MRWLQRLLKKVKRSVKYVKLVWQTEDYDYSFALEFWKHSLLEVKQSMLKGYIAEPERYTKRIDEIVALLTRIQDYDKYTEKFEDDYDEKYGELTYNFERIEGKGLSRMNFTNEKRETPEARAELKRIWSHGEYLYKQDIDRLALLLKKYLRNFWD